MNLKQLKDEFRGKAGDEIGTSAGAFFWSDNEITTWLNESVNEACLRANLIYDEASDVCALVAKSGTASYEIDPSIYRITNAIFESASGPRVLTIRARRDMDRPHRHFRHSLVYGDVPWDWRSADPGTPSVLLHDGATVTLWKTPDVDGTVHIGVYRLPVDPMASPTDEPEIPPPTHLSLIDWALSLALLKDDPETRRVDLSKFHADRFEQYFGPRPSAYAQVRRRSNPRHTVRAAHF